MNTEQTPDYGEPWQRSCAEMYVINRHGEAHCICGKRLERTISCVNAYAGMADPAAEIEAMREAIKEASLQVSAFLGFYSDSLTLPQMRSLSECINKLQPFLTEPKQHEQTKHQH